MEVRCYILISNISGSVKVAPLQILQFPVILPHKFQDAEKFNLQFSDFSEITETADKLRWLRYQKGLRQRDVADYAGIYRSTYIHYEEYGKDFYSPKHMEKIAQLFEVPVERLLDDYNLFLRNGQGKQIKAIRMKLGLTQREYADNPKCRELQLDYYRLIQTIGSREAITRRFLVIFEYEAVTNRKPEYSEIVSALETAVQTARQYFLHCDNAVVTHDDENAFLLEILYTIFNRSTCEVKTVEQRIRELQSARRDADITMPVSLKSVFAPDSIDLTHGSYVVMDGVYHAYLIVPSDGYNPRVVAGWTSILVNAGEGIDVDFYFSREPKERIQATPVLLHSRAAVPANRPWQV